MLVLRRSRSREEALTIGEDITVVAHPDCVEVRIGEIEIRISNQSKDIVKIAVKASEDILILREELRIRGQRKMAPS